MKSEVEKVNKFKVGKFISSIRKNKGLVQQNIADYTGANFKTVSKWENGYAFPDVKYQRKLCEILEITTEELQMGEYNNKKRKKLKQKDIIFKITLIILVFLIPVVVFLASYFSLTYNTQKVYMLYANDNNDFFVQGLLIHNRKYSTVYLGNVDFANYKFKDEDQISVDLYSNEILIYHTNSNSFLNANFNNEDIDINNLKIVISIKPYKKDLIVYEENLNIREYEEEEKIESVNNNHVSQDIIINNLLNNGFVKSNDNYIKTENDYSYIYYPETCLFTISYESKPSVKHINYFVLIDNFDVSVYENKNGIRTVLEQYKYDLKDDNLDCQIGQCTTIDDIKVTIKKYKTLLMGE